MLEVMSSLEGTLGMEEMLVLLKMLTLWNMLKSIPIFRIILLLNFLAALHPAVVLEEGEEERPVGVGLLVICDPLCSFTAEKTFSTLNASLFRC